MNKKHIFTTLILAAIVSVISAPTAASAETTNDKIHFISTGQSDCILIESNGRFGLIDSGEDTGTSRTRLPQSEIDAIKDLPGYEDEIIDYLHSLGVWKLDFAIATHSHSDHIGNFDLIFDKFPTAALYTREYKDTFINSDGEEENLFANEYEYKWDNQEMYDDMISSANRNNVDIIYIDENSPMKDLNFKFGDFTIDIVNNQSYNNEIDRADITIPSENANSFGVVVSKNNKRAFLAGDISNSDGDEEYLITNSRTKNLIKNVDVFKFGHHGINGTVNFLNHINPNLSIITGPYPNSSTIGFRTIQTLGLKNIYTTVDNSNIVVNFYDSGAITTNAQKEYTITNGWKLDSGKWYYLIEGKPITGLNLVGSNGNNHWFYFDETGVMQTGWQKIIKDGQENLYYFDESGIMFTGWHLINNNGEINWYYFNSTGIMSTGWKLINYNGKNTWFYFDGSGKMLTDWQLIDYKGKKDWYYFDGSGQMLTGWQSISYKGQNEWFYFDGSGKMLTGWQLIDYKGKSDWYYFDGSGKMLTGWQLISYNGQNDWYYFDGSGIMLTGWQLISYKGQNDWYYFNNDGSMKTGTFIDGGKTYFLREKTEGIHPMGSMV